MKKSFILVAIVALSLSTVSLASVNVVVANTNAISVLTVNPVKEQANGIILEVTDKGGKIQEEGTGIVRDFFHPGAQVQYVIGDAVSYRIITFPNGKPPVVIDIKKPN